jgi:hypothetical protein
MSEDPNAFSNRYYQNEQEITRNRRKHLGGAATGMSNYTADGAMPLSGGQSARFYQGGMTHILKNGAPEDDQTSSSAEEEEEEGEAAQDISESSLSNYTHTDDIRKMFAKSPADLA